MPPDVFSRGSQFPIQDPKTKSENLNPRIILNTNKQQQQQTKSSIATVIRGEIPVLNPLEEGQLIRRRSNKARWIDLWE